MFYSTDHILTTHAGSLPRPADLREMVVARTRGEAYDATALDRRLRSAVAEAVRRQRGNAARISWATIGESAPSKPSQANA